MRKAMFAGKFYEEDKKSLNNQIETCFYSKLGPQDMPKLTSKKTTKIFGAVSPHAGYYYSGAGMAFVYKEIAEIEKRAMPDVFIILGTNHTGMNNFDFSLSLEDFETPLGIAENEKSLTELIIQNKNIEILANRDEAPHLQEHSIEVQLPFIQFIYNLKNKNFTFVPIIVCSNDLDKIKKFSETLSEIIKKYELENKKKVMIIASSDMTHYGLSYGFLPFSPKEAKERMITLDGNAIQSILKCDIKNFHEKAKNMTICGTFTIITMLETIRKLGAKKGFLLKYYNSGDITKDYGSVVGYASMIFK